MIISNARKTAERLKKKKKEFSRDDFLKCRVSTVPLWKRIVVIFVGLGFTALAVLMYFEADNPVWAVMFWGISVVILLIGFLGRREKIDTILCGMDAGISSNIIDGIF